MVLLVLKAVEGSAMALMVSGGMARLGGGRSANQAAAPPPPPPPSASCSQHHQPCQLYPKLDLSLKPPSEAINRGRRS